MCAFFRVIWKGNQGLPAPTQRPEQTPTRVRLRAHSALQPFICFSLYSSPLNHLSAFSDCMQANCTNICTAKTPFSSPSYHHSSAFGVTFGGQQLCFRHCCQGWIFIRSDTAVCWRTKIAQGLGLPSGCQVPHSPGLFPSRFSSEM